MFKSRYIFIFILHTTIFLLLFLTLPLLFILSMTPSVTDSNRYTLPLYLWISLSLSPSLSLYLSHPLCSSLFISLSPSLSLYLSPSLFLSLSISYSLSLSSSPCRHIGRSLLFWCQSCRYGDQIRLQADFSFQRE